MSGAFPFGINHAPRARTPMIGCVRSNTPASHCPFLDRADERCSNRFRLEHLKHAFKFCFGRYKACPMYLQLQVERRIRGIESAVLEPMRDGDDSLVQITVGAGNAG
jgi:hypothetical protein